MLKIFQTYKNNKFHKNLINIIRLENKLYGKNFSKRFSRIFVSLRVYNYIKLFYTIFLLYMLSNYKIVSN